MVDIIYFKEYYLIISFKLKITLRCKKYNYTYMKIFGEEI